MKGAYRPPRDSARDIQKGRNRESRGGASVVGKERRERGGWKRIVDRGRWPYISRTNGGHDQQQHVVGERIMSNHATFISPSAGENTQNQKHRGEERHTNRAQNLTLLDELKD